MPRNHNDDVLAALDAWEAPTEEKKLGIAARAASLLDYAAKKKPGAAISWSYLTKRVMDLGKMPGPDSDMVRLMKNRCSGIREVLGRDYDRGLENITGLGVRATKDDDDFVATQIKRKAVRAKAAVDSLHSDVAKIDRTALKNKENRAWINNLVPQLSAYNDRMSKLLLPPGHDDKDPPSSNGAKK